MINLDWSLIKITKYLVPPRVAVLISQHTSKWMSSKTYLVFLLSWIRNFIFCCLPYKQLWHSNGNVEIKLFILLTIYLVFINFTICKLEWPNLRCHFIVSLSHPSFICVKFKARSSHVIPLPMRYPPSYIQYVCAYSLVVVKWWHICLEWIQTLSHFELICPTTLFLRTSTRNMFLTFVFNLEVTLIKTFPMPIAYWVFIIP